MPISKLWWCWSGGGGGGVGSGGVGAVLLERYELRGLDTP